MGGRTPYSEEDHYGGEVAVEEEEELDERPSGWPDPPDLWEEEEV